MKAKIFRINATSRTNRLRAAFDAGAAPPSFPIAPAILFGAALFATVWAVASAPRAPYLLVGLVATAAALEALAGDIVRSGRRIVTPSLAVMVAAYIVAGPAAAVLAGIARGTVRIMTPRVTQQTDAVYIVSSATLAPFLGGLAGSALGLEAGAAWVGGISFVAVAYLFEVGVATALLSRTWRPSILRYWEQTIGWTSIHYVLLGGLGVFLGLDIAAGRWFDILYFAVPLVVIRHGFGVFNRRSEQYVAALEADSASLFDRVGQLDRCTGELIEALATAVDSREGAERGHCMRTASVACAIAADFGCSGVDLEVLRRAALLHDIGTLSIPASIISKPLPLTQPEWEQMRQHVELGASLVRKWRGCGKMADIIEQHHECFDGSGYPNGLFGEQILPEARIIAVADAYATLTAGEAHRAAVSPVLAIAEIEACAGSQFDPRIVEVLTRIADSRVADVLPLARRRG